MWWKDIEFDGWSLLVGLLLCAAFVGAYAIIKEVVEACL